MNDKTVANIDFCIASMNRSLMGSAEFLQIELSVSLLVFSDIGATDIAARKMLREVYASSGYDCLKKESPHYSTVLRRMDRSAALLNKIGIKKLLKAIGGKRDQEALESILALLKPFELMNWDDVQQFATGVDKKVARAPKQPKEHARRATDAPDTIHLKTEHIDIAIPAAATHKEIMELVTKLIQVAESAKMAA